MKIFNLEQIRASRALGDAREIRKKREGNGDQLSGYHSLIITNGLLATLAYSADKGGECKLIAECLVAHLAHLQKLDLFPGNQLCSENDLDIMMAIRKISDTGTSPQQLAMMTDECMAYLNYLKRFVRAGKTFATSNQP